VIGTILNAGGIIIGGIAGVWRRRPLTPAQESFFKVLLGAFTVFYGLRLTWMSITGPGTHATKQLFIAILALTLGKLTGRLLKLQNLSNRVGQYASSVIASASIPGSRPPRGTGFKVCAGLFCAAPLAFAGAIQDGLSGYYEPLAVKAVMDGLATMGLSLVFGLEVLLAALPVFVMQGSLTLLCSHLVRPWLEQHGLLQSLGITNGLLIFSVALVLLQLKRIALAEYLPSLLFAPLLTWVWP